MIWRRRGTAINVAHSHFFRPVHTHAHTRVCVCVWCACINVAHSHSFSPVHTHAHTCVCVCVWCACVCVYVCIFMYINISIYIMRRMRERDDENRHNTSFPKLPNGESAPLSPERGHVSRTPTLTLYSILVLILLDTLMPVFGSCWVQTWRERPLTAGTPLNFAITFTATWYYSIYSRLLHRLLLPVFHIHTHIDLVFKCERLHDTFVHVCVNRAPSSIYINM